MGPEEQWRAALNEGRLLIQRARASGRCFFPPRVAEPGTGDLDWQWVDASGGGSVYSVTVVHPRPPAEPYNIVLVDLAEGVKMMGRVEGIVEPAIGAAVRARVGRDRDEPLVLFDLA